MAGEQKRVDQLDQVTALDDSDRLLVQRVGVGETAQISVGDARGSFGGGLIAPTAPGAPGTGNANAAAGATQITAIIDPAPGEPAEPISAPYYLLLDEGESNEELVIVTDRSGGTRMLAAPLVYSHGSGMAPRYCGPATESSAALGAILSAQLYKLSQQGPARDGFPSDEPKPAGTGALGSNAQRYARADHVHPKAAPLAHASSHHTGGADAITPADIGAAAAAHTHDKITGPAGTVDVSSGSTITIAAGSEVAVPGYLESDDLYVNNNITSNSAVIGTCEIDNDGIFPGTSDKKVGDAARKWGEVHADRIYAADIAPLPPIHVDTPALTLTDAHHGRVLFCTAATVITAPPGLRPGTTVMVYKGEGSAGGPTLVSPGVFARVPDGFQARPNRSGSVMCVYFAGDLDGLAPMEELSVFGDLYPEPEP